MPVTTILFDAGGTLVFPSFARIAAELAAAGHPVDPDDLARADVRVRFELDRPEIIAATNDGSRFDRYLNGLAHGAGLATVPADVLARLRAYHDVQNLWEDVPSDVPVALERLRGRFRLGVVSNANGTVRAKLARVGLARLPDHRRFGRGGGRETRSAHLRDRAGADGGRGGGDRVRR